MYSMASTFQYSENSAFSPVPFEVYDYPPVVSSSSVDPQALLADYELRHNQAMVDHWVNVHQQSPPYDTPSVPYGFFTYPYLQECLSSEPGFIRKRNERERMRVRNVNEGYARLRDHLPLEPTEKRLSKVETLRGAIRYIKLLQSVLGEPKQAMTPSATTTQRRTSDRSDGEFDGRNYER
eukprot:TCONS_00000914-protein